MHLRRPTKPDPVAILSLLDPWNPSQYNVFRMLHPKGQYSLRVPNGVIDSSLSMLHFLASSQYRFNAVGSEQLRYRCHKFDLGKFLPGTDPGTGCPWHERPLQRRWEKYVLVYR